MLGLKLKVSRVSSSKMLQMDANGMQSRRFQLPNAANGQESKKQTRNCTPEEPYKQMLDVLCQFLGSHLLPDQVKPAVLLVFAVVRACPEMAIPVPLAFVLAP